MSVLVKIVDRVFGRSAGDNLSKCKNTIKAIAFYLLLCFSVSTPQASASADVPDLDGWIDNPSEILEIEWMGPLGFSSARPGSWIQNKLEERYNIKFKPIFLDSVAYTKTRSLHFVAGDIPDVFWDGDPIGVRSKARHGFVLELPYEIILHYAPNYVAYINKHAPEAWMFSRWAGKNWGVPTVIPAGNIPPVYVWRGDWLKNVGLPNIPETIDEAHEAFRRFTFNDPDGNGKNDTYGLSPSMVHWSYFFAEFFSARGVLPFDLQEVDGKITWGGIRPEAREVLAMLRKWYAEGIIAPDFVLCRTNEQHETPFLNGKVGYYGPGQFSSLLNTNSASSMVSRIARLQPQAKLVAAPPLKGWDGHQRGRVWGGGGHVLQFSSEIPKNKVVRVLRMLDATYADINLSIEAIMGQRGKHWEHSVSEGVYPVEPYTSKERNGEHEMISAANMRNYGFFAPSGLPLDVVNTFSSERERDAMRRFTRPEWGISNAIGKTDALESSSVVLPDLRRLQEKYYIDIIRGTIPLESFDNFVQLWLKRGGQKLLDEAQNFRIQREDIYHKVGAQTKKQSP